jgi:neuralized-like protein 4
MAFHRKCGKRIQLSNNNRTALRNVHEFNHGIVLSEKLLVDDSIFEIRVC